MVIRMQPETRPGRRALRPDAAQRARSGAQVLERVRAEDFVVDATATATPVPATAEAVLRAAGWQ